MIRDSYYRDDLVEATAEREAHQVLDLERTHWRVRPVKNPSFRDTMNNFCNPKKATP